MTSTQPGLPGFVGQARPRAWLAARHVTGPGLVGPEGLWGLAIKGAGEPAPRHVGLRHAVRAAGLQSIEANPHYQALRTATAESTVKNAGMSRSNCPWSGRSPWSSRGWSQPAAACYRSSHFPATRYCSSGTR